MKIKTIMKKVVATVLIVTSTITFATEVGVKAAEESNLYFFDTLGTPDFEYSSYDITGDGKKDTLKFSILDNASDGDSSMKVAVYVNGAKAFTKTEQCVTEMEMTVVPYKSQRFLFVQLWEETDAHVDDFVLCWKDGKLEQVLDIQDEMGAVGVIRSAEVNSLYGGKLSIRFTAQNDAIGLFDGWNEYKIGNQSLTKVSNKSGIYADNLRCSNANGSYYYDLEFKAAKNVKVYKKVDKKNVAFTLKKGKKIWISDVYVKNSKVMFYGRYGTKEGWFVPKINMFQDVILGE
ncbi:MAG: hypothetical protein II838_07245 [Lachnospiraceae bacterium]|nr:hypothetical protein [Lachnospiraceae bacterium]